MRITAPKWVLELTGERDVVWRRLLVPSDSTLAVFTSSCRLVSTARTSTSIVSGFTFPFYVGRKALGVPSFKASQEILFPGAVPLPFSPSRCRIRTNNFPQAQGGDLKKRKFMHSAPRDCTSSKRNVLNRKLLSNQTVTSQAWRTSRRRRDIPGIFGFAVNWIRKQLILKQL